jgi:hypothetical protein
VVLKEIADATGGSFYYIPGGTQADYERALDEIFAIIETPVDNVPPIVTLTATPNVLWPPNHKMIKIEVQKTVTDNLDPAPKVELVGVTTTEPFDAQGSGNTDGDIEVRTDGSIHVRAERSGSSNGRIYTITYKATDASGNIGYGSVDVRVPKSQSGKMN